MDKEKLFGEVLAQKARESTGTMTENARAANQQRQQEVRDADHRERMAVFETLDERAERVRSGVKQFVEAGNSWQENVTPKLLHNKWSVLVVLGAAPKSPVTLDHTAVCVVSHVQPFSHYGVYTGQDEFAQFRFAFIPTALVAAAAKADERNPLLGLRKDEISISDENTINPEQAFSVEANSVSRKFDSSRSARKRCQDLLANNAASVEAWEKSLAWVQQAAADLALNRHLQPQPVA